MKPLSSSLPCTSRRGFSIVELLTVVAIIAVLSTLVGVGTGSKPSRQLESTGLKVANILELARQNSMSRDAMTAVVLTTIGSPQVAVFELRPRIDGAALTSADWIQVGRWEVLPDGIVVDKDTFADGAAAATPAPPVPRLKGQTVKPEEFSYATFLPSGRLADSNSATLRFAAGQGGSAFQTASDGDPVNYFKLTVISATGRVKIDRR